MSHDALLAEARLLRDALDEVYKRMDEHDEKADCGTRFTLTLDMVGEVLNDVEQRGLLED